MSLLKSLRLNSFWLMLCRLAVALGCGGSDFPVAPISGTITLDGEPLAGARIGFEPRAKEGSLESGPGSYAKTDANGHYVLETLDGRTGAVVTTHDVWIRTQVNKADRGDLTIEAVAEKVPARYNSESELTFEVTSAGTDAADFKLVTKED